ncbi:Gfo/Idh/MocA family oxidoreductase [Clostridium sp. D2Q-11]|uniref:Gfo/Idh/MocA family oxidoreductase n=1 Tax=Anaeromonas frigoriresistens TaxID=2683708 RepID=A0A942UTG4_9FIRM|nr:Gfo/Idh/MocA family oxidoreductase [Anaeromonas frigoriresistens]MBS4538833.1 Gfo/Idh/MocA family oxidoreductase [Anaeromonas frigoriresistens]
MGKLRFAILGCGRISKKHAEAIANNHREVELIAVCDHKDKKMEATIDKYYEILSINKSNINNNIKKYLDYKEMLKDESIDVVAIATQSGYHAKITIDCLNRGKHVIVEKPMALSLEDAEEMISTSRKKNLKLTVCYQNRFNPPIQKLRKAIEEKRFGKIVNGTARILWNRDDNYYKQSDWRGTWELDGGALMNQCIHNIDLLQWMLGGKVDRVYANTGNFLRNIEAEDFGVIIIRFQNEAIGMVEGSVCVYPENLEETLSIFGEKGTAVIGGIAVNKIETWNFEDKENIESDVENQEIYTTGVYGDGHTPLFKDTIDAIKQDREPYITGEEGKKSLEIVLAAYKSQYYSKKILFPVGNVSTLEFK